MRVLQRATTVIGWLSFAAVGVLLVLESANVINDEWRDALARTLSAAAQPTAANWIAALIGAATAIVAVAVLAAQLVPWRTAVRAITIDSQETGETVVTAPTIYRRLSHELSGIDGVHSVTPIPHRTTLRFRVELIDSANAVAVSDDAYRRMTSDVWRSLGTEPRPVNIVMTYRRSATPVTRKEQLV